MNQKSLNCGIGITVIWLAVITSFWMFGGLSSPTSLNELGDFLAGIFAPIAFLWLILGYVQQGKQLEQNTKALEQQEKALQLQIDEMRESVKQQTNLVSLQEQQLKSARKAVRSQLNLSRTTFFEHEDRYEDRDNDGNIIDVFDIYIVCIYLNLKNYGEEAKNIYFFDEDFKRYESLLISLSKNEEQRVQINLLKEQYTKLFADKELMIRGKIGYEDKYGNLYDFKVKFTITTPRKNPRVGFQISQESI